MTVAIGATRLIMTNSLQSLPLVSAAPPAPSLEESFRAVNDVSVLLPGQFHGLLVESPQRVQDVIKSYNESAGVFRSAGEASTAHTSEAQEERMARFSFNVRSGSLTTSDGFVNACFHGYSLQVRAMDGRHRQKI